MVGRVDGEWVRRRRREGAAITIGHADGEVWWLNQGLLHNHSRLRKVLAYRMQIYIEKDCLGTSFYIYI